MLYYHFLTLFLKSCLMTIKEIFISNLKLFKPEEIPDDISEAGIEPVPYLKKYLKYKQKYLSIKKKST